MPVSRSLIVFTGIMGAGMNLLTDSVKKIYVKYLAAALGSAVIVSIYSTVDAVVVGQYEGADGSAALGCVMPMWSMFMSISILIGIGSSILMSTARGNGNKRLGDEYFTAGMIVAGVLSCALVVLFALYRDKFLRLCGAEGKILTLAMAYTHWLTFAVPLFLVGNIFMAFVRNDNAPQLATAAVICGGLLNIPGDIFFVFGLKWGIGGAGFSTAVSQLVTCIVLAGHVFSKSNSLHPVQMKFSESLTRIKRLVETGFAPFIVDFSFGISVILFNNQIMKYAGTVELAVYGVVVNVALLFQSLFYGVGQAVQPLVSENNGAQKYDRIHEFLRLALITVFVMSAAFFALAELLPEQILRMYMRITPEVLFAGPRILRVYAVSFLLMGVNIVAGYYLQAVLCTASSLTVSLLRGCVLNSLFVLVLPAVFGYSAIWYTMPLAELCTFVATVILLRRQRVSVPNFKSSGRRSS